MFFATFSETNLVIAVRPATAHGSSVVRPTSAVAVAAFAFGATEMPVDVQARDVVKQLTTFIRTQAMDSLHLLHMFRRDMSQRRDVVQRLTELVTSVWPSHVKRYVTVVEAIPKDKDDNQNHHTMHLGDVRQPRLGKIRTMVVHALFPTQGHSTPAFTERREIMVIIAAFGAWPMIA